MALFRLTDAAPVEIAIETLVVAGWTGRDPSAVAQHVEELVALGVAPPSRTPLFYRAGAELVTAAPRIEVLGGATSGEAEAVLLAGPEGVMVGLGSDHTDRAAEAWSVAHAKQLCPKPLAPALWPLEEVAAHWDRLVLTAWARIDGARVLYQQGTLDALLRPEALIAAHGALAPGTALFCGTLPAIGDIRPAERFEMALEDPVLGRRIAHGYDVSALPAVA